MSESIKSGKQVLEEFIINIKNDENLDVEIADTVANLFEQNKLSKINLLNALSDIREQKKNEN